MAPKSEPIDPLPLLDAGEAVVAGVLSGTSGDGIDVALTRPRPLADPGLPEVLAFATLPFEPGLRERVRRALDGDSLDVRQVALLDRDLGRAFGQAARTLAVTKGLALDLVGSHGQTVWHHDDQEPSGPATLQLGDGAEVAAAARATAVVDFRSADIAAGGGGAPLVSLVEGELFPDEPRPLVVLNLGGMANLTSLSADGTLVAFDVGPAGALLDGLARRLLDQPLDRDGAAASTGQPDPDWIANVLSHPYLSAQPPKSTGRDTFGEDWVDEILARGSHLTPACLLRSGAEAIAAAVAKAVHGLPAARRLIVAGGGVHHAPLMAALGERTGISTVSSAQAGIDPDAREALAFALFASRAVRGVPSSHPGATGARHGAILGKICRFHGGPELTP